MKSREEAHSIFSESMFNELFETVDKNMRSIHDQRNFDDFIIINADNNFNRNKEFLEKYFSSDSDF
jgi:hypothetical protein